MTLSDFTAERALMPQLKDLSDNAIRAYKVCELYRQMRTADLVETGIVQQD